MLEDGKDMCAPLDDDGYMVTHVRVVLFACVKHVRQRSLQHVQSTLNSMA